VPLRYLFRRHTHGYELNFLRMGSLVFTKHLNGQLRLEFCGLTRVVSMTHKLSHQLDFGRFGR